MSQNVGSHNFAMVFKCTGLGTLSEQTLTVKVKRHDGSSFERTTETGDVAVIDDALFLLGVRIKDGDFTVKGWYYYQVSKRTPGSVGPRTRVGKFYVNNSL